MAQPLLELAPAHIRDTWLWLRDLHPSCSIFVKQNSLSPCKESRLFKHSSTHEAHDVLWVCQKWMPRFSYLQGLNETKMLLSPTESILCEMRPTFPRWVSVTQENMRWGLLSGVVPLSFSAHCESAFPGLYKETIEGGPGSSSTLYWDRHQSNCGKSVLVDGCVHSGVRE